MTTPRYPGGEWIGQTRNTSGAFARGQPKFLVMHYTAGGDGRRSAEYLRDPHDPSSSAHFVVDRDGKVYQLSDINMTTWHAGRSEWKGFSMLNRFSIGIEFANYGYLRKVPDSSAWLTGASNYKSKLSYPAEHPPIVARHKNGGPEQGWEAYYPDQIANGLELTRWLLGACPTIREIVGHDDIAPKRKTDPGPAFPMPRFVDLLHPDSEGSKPVAGNIEGEPGTTPVAASNAYKVNATVLNVRGGPGTNFETLSWGPLKRNKTVRLLKENGEWSFIEYRGERSTESGWVFSQFISPT
jgi:N-acetylmuramoyl-L-alanine amidase